MMQQDIPTTHVEKTQRHAIEIDSDLAIAEERHEDSAIETNKAAAPKTRYGRAWREEYACW